jgi:hypothetical protein
MIMLTYQEARKRWRAACWDQRFAKWRPERAGWTRPDAKFFDTVISARAEKWGLRREQDWSVGLSAPMDGLEAEIRRDTVKEMLRVANDMRDWGFVVPQALRIRLDVLAPLNISAKRQKRSRELAVYSKLEVKLPKEELWPVFAHPPSVDDELASFPSDWSKDETEVGKIETRGVGA